VNEIAEEMDSSDTTVRTKMRKALKLGLAERVKKGRNYWYRVL
jgi:predicted transcriptional regulator